MLRYLDIEAILAEEERIPCVFTTDALRLGFLSQSTQQTNEIAATKTLAKESKVELPLWLASQLADKHMVQIQLPLHYGSKIRDSIMANALSVNLREYSYYYFIIGRKLCHVFKDDDLLRSLRIAFCGDRFRMLLVHCMSSGHVDNTEFAQTLTSSELRIYKEGLLTSEEMLNWKTRKTFLLQKSSILGRRLSSKKDNDNKSNKKRHIQF